MVFVSYYTRVVSQFVIFICTKVFLLRGVSASPYFDFDKGQHIIIANHRSGLDPFVIVSSLRVRDFFRLAPFSFMTANKFMKPLWLRPFAWLAGCFPAHPGIGRYGVDKAIQDITDGYTFVIFPEGKRVTGAAVEPKKGIELILDAVPESRTILTHIKWKSSRSVDSITMSYPPAGSNSQTAEAIMESIYKL